MIYNLPKSVIVDDTEYKICNDCDYRTVLDVIEVLNDKELIDISKIKCSLYLFYQDIYDRFSNEEDTDLALIDWDLSENDILLYQEMMKIVAGGEEDKDNTPPQKLMDWEHDFKNMTAPISRVLGYSVRDSKNYTHWYDFIGAYGEIGDCYWAQVMNIRKKRQEGRPLDETDRKFYREHRKDIDLPMNMSDEEKEWLDEDW